MRTRIKTIWAIRAEQSERLAPVASDCHKLMKKQKSESVKRYREIYKSNRPAMAVRYILRNSVNICVLLQHNSIKADNFCCFFFLVSQVIQVYGNKFPVRHLQLRSLRCRAWKSSIHKLRKNRRIQMPNTFQTHLDFYPSAGEQPNFALDLIFIFFLVVFLQTVLRFS